MVDVVDVDEIVDQAIARRTGGEEAAAERLRRQSPERRRQPLAVAGEQGTQLRLDAVRQGDRHREDVLGQPRADHATDLLVHLGEVQEGLEGVDVAGQCQRGCRRRDRGVTRPMTKERELTEDRARAGDRDGLDTGRPLPRDRDLSCDQQREELPGIAFAHQGVAAIEVTGLQLRGEARELVGAASGEQRDRRELDAVHVRLPGVLHEAEPLGLGFVARGLRDHQGIGIAAKQLMQA